MPIPILDYSNLRVLHVWKKYKNIFSLNASDVVRQVGIKVIRTGILNIMLYYAQWNCSTGSEAAVQLAPESSLSFRFDLQKANDTSLTKSSLFEAELTSRATSVVDKKHTLSHIKCPWVIINSAVWWQQCGLELTKREKVAGWEQPRLWGRVVFPSL